MRTTLLRLALLGSTATAIALGAGPVLAQTSPATPDSARPPAATEGATRPGTVPPAPRVERMDSIRPDRPNEAARQGGQGIGAPRNDTATGAAATTGTQGATGGNSAVTIDEGARRGPLEAGANSFTEGQARSRMEEAGFTNVEGLQKDGNGVWRGRAMQGGRQVEVGLDYRGNVSPAR